MIIEESNVVLASTHSKVQRYERHEELQAWTKHEELEEQDEGRRDQVSISDRAMRRLEKDLGKALKHFDRHMEKAEEHPEKGMEKAYKHLDRDLEKAIDHLEKSRSAEEIQPIKIGGHEADIMGLLKGLVEALTGRDTDVKELHHMMEDRKHKEREQGDDDSVSSGEEQRDRFRWGVEYSRHESYYEKEQTTFNAGGIVRTADGREINFSLDLSMSREFFSESSLKMAADGIASGNVLVDFEGPASDLAEPKTAFEFEPESEGTQRPYLALGGGVLSLDIDGSGSIDSLDEVFGTTSGNGFDDLAVHDEDGNGWIDENDSVFEKLSIFSKDSAGNDSLTGLKANNIGAIYLANVESEFSLGKNEELQRSGIYLNEDGTPGTVQQLSIVV